MLYVKNVPTWERILRVLMGMAGLAFAAMNWGISGMAVGIGAMGAMLAMTGLFGFGYVTVSCGSSTHYREKTRRFPYGVGGFHI